MLMSLGSTDSGTRPSAFDGALAPVSRLQAQVTCGLKPAGPALIRLRLFAPARASARPAVALAHAVQAEAGGPSKHARGGACRRCRRFVFSHLLFNPRVPPPPSCPSWPSLPAPPGWPDLQQFVVRAAIGAQFLNLPSGSSHGHPPPQLACASLLMQNLRHLVLPGHPAAALV